MFIGQRIINLIVYRTENQMMSGSRRKSLQLFWRTNWLDIDCYENKKGGTSTTRNKKRGPRDLSHKKKSKKKKAVNLEEDEEEEVLPSDEDEEDKANVNIPYIDNFNDNPHG